MFGCSFEPNHYFIEPLRHGGIYPRNTDTGVLTSRRTSRNRPSPSSLAPRSGRQSNQININRGKPCSALAKLCC